MPPDEQTPHAGGIVLDGADPTRLVLCGDLDVYAVVGHHLGDAQLAAVRVVDLQAVDFVDSAGLGFLIGLSQQVRPHRLRLDGVHGTARQMLLVMGAHHVLDL